MLGRLQATVFNINKSSKIIGSFLVRQLNKMFAV